MTEPDQDDWALKLSHRLYAVTYFNQESATFASASGYHERRAEIIREAFEEQKQREENPDDN